MVQWFMQADLHNEYLIDNEHIFLNQLIIGFGVKKVQNDELS